MDISHEELEKYEDNLAMLEILKQSIRADTPRWDLVPWEAMEVVAQVMAHGEAKHERDGWMRVPPREHSNHLLSHAFQAIGGNPNEAESGLSHWAHVAARALILIWHARQGKVTVGEGGRDGLEDGSEQDR